MLFIQLTAVHASFLPCGLGLRGPSLGFSMLLGDMLSSLADCVMTIFITNISCKLKLEYLILNSEVQLHNLSAMDAKTYLVFQSTVSYMSTMLTYPWDRKIYQIWRNPSNTNIAIILKLSSEACSHTWCINVVPWGLWAVSHYGHPRQEAPGVSGQTLSSLKKWVEISQ